MRVQNIRFLENLNIYASLAGIFNIFIGLMIIFMDIVHRDWRHVQVGIYVFITGYAFVKVSQKIGLVVLDERKLNAVELMDQEKLKNKEDLEPPRTSEIV